MVNDSFRRKSYNILRGVPSLNYKSYQNMRNATWKILLASKVDRLPIDIDAVCSTLGIRVFSYDAGAEIIERAHLYRTARDFNGLTFYLRDTPVILFNPRAAGGSSNHVYPCP